MEVPGAGPAVHVAANLLQNLRAAAAGVEPVHVESVYVERDLGLVSAQARRAEATGRINGIIQVADLTGQCEPSRRT
ncbi:MAG: hypothetical protein QOF35_1147 [Actinomycetota bacterium]|nr:hypothetical protein [Actinomycetota bacterium]